MNQIIPFIFDEKPVRTVMVNEFPWWVGKDVCGVLGYTNTNKAINDHCKGVTKRYPLETMGGRQEVRIINEGDVFRLIVNSRLPQAQRFEMWLFEEVLPQVRKTGGYGHSKELEALRKQVMKLEVEITNALVPTVFENQELREENRRLKNRYICTPDDKREILDLSKTGFNITQIKEKTKKGKARIKRIIAEAAANTQPGLWDQTDNAASRG